MANFGIKYECKCMHYLSMHVVPSATAPIGLEDTPAADASRCMMAGSALSEAGSAAECEPDWPCVRTDAGGGVARCAHNSSMSALSA